jgi:hypothetical protein
MVAPSKQAVDEAKTVVRRVRKQIKRTDKSKEKH